jgi:hypothetical protein
MAGEISHVVYGARTLEYLDDKVKAPSFWAGTLFPDIRHLGIVSRRRTHPGDVSLGTLAGGNDFETGMRVHAWIDSTRNRFLEEANIKESLQWHPFVPHALKLFEDELLYERFDDWNLIERVLNKVHDQELKYVNSLQHITKWHDLLRNYFEQKPDNDSRFKLSIAIGLSEHSAEEVNNVVAMIKADNRAEALIERLVHHFEFLLR